MSPVAPSPSPTKRLLLVGWDAADWQVIDPLLEAGRMPHLARLVNGGVMASLATLHPIVSPMLWTSIATGKLADKHGIHGFTERDPISGARPAFSTSRRTKAIWNIFQQALGWRCNVVDWWASYPAEPLAGASVSNTFFRTKVGESNEKTWRVPVDAVHPPELAGKLLPQLLHISEIDETLALPFVPRAAEIDQKADRRLENLARLVTECVNVHTVTTALMEQAPWDFTAVYFDSIDHFSHTFMPYHPPRMDNVSERDFELYGEVMRGIYMFQDMMLGRLVELAGPEATVVVCSDHGFQSGGLRPQGSPREPAGPVLWHREFGVLVMSGPGLKKDERIYGANLLDIVPTLLTLAGLPAGRDMDGKPLLEALENPAAPPPIDSWDDVPGDDGRHPAGFVPDAASGQNEDLLRQFAALGYIEDPGEDREKAGADAERENRYNLAEVYLSTSRAVRAVPLLEALAAEYPWETRYLHQLANAYLGAEYYQAAYDLLERAYPPKATDEEPPVVVYQMFAKARLRLGHRLDAAHYLRYAAGRMLRFPHLWVESGYLWLDLGNLAAAEHCFRRAVELDADAASAFQGLSSVYLHRRENAAAAGAALDAVQRLYHLPFAHLNLGIALAREDRFDEALVALGRAVTMRPNLLDAHRWLAAIYSSRRPDSLRAGVHRNRARQIGQDRARTAAARHSRATERRPLPDNIPPTSVRTRRGEEARPMQVHAGTSGRTLVLVSGLPRSGTSLMMQMLAAGGLPPKTDGERAADADNPEGYLEWEAIKRIGREPHLFDDPGLDHQAIKVVSALLPDLPRRHRYRVIFMVRPVAEIVRSQAKMIARRGTIGADAGQETLAANLQTHRDTTLANLHADEKVYDVLEVDYPGLVADPAPWVQRVVEFIGADLLPHSERMAAVVRGDLHRNRSANP